MEEGCNPRLPAQQTKSPVLMTPDQMLRGVSLLAGNIAVISSMWSQTLVHQKPTMADVLNGKHERQDQTTGGAVAGFSPGHG